MSSQRKPEALVAVYAHHDVPAKLLVRCSINYVVGAHTGEHIEVPTGNEVFQTEPQAATILVNGCSMPISF